MKSNFKKRAVTAIFLTSLLTCSYAFTNQVMAQEVNNQQQGGIPGANRRRGAASRGCSKHAAGSLMALVPENKETLTKSAHPKLLFHLPQTSTPMDMEFVVVDAKHNPVYEHKFQTNGSAGIITMDFPKSIALEQRQKLRWYLSILCNPQNRAHDIVVDGWIQRGEDNKNYWQDSLAALAELRRQNPNDAQLLAKWKKLLAEENLTEIAQQPLINLDNATPGQVSLNKQ